MEVNKNTPTRHILLLALCNAQESIAAVRDRTGGLSAVLHPGELAPAAATDTGVTLAAAAAAAECLRDEKTCTAPLLP